MRDAKYRAASAEAEIRDISKKATEAISRLESRCLLIDAAMRVIMKHDLLTDLSHELNNSPAALDPSSIGTVAKENRNAKI